MRVPYAIRRWWRVRRCAWHAMTPDGRKAHAAVVLLAVCLPAGLAMATPPAMAMFLGLGQDVVQQDRIVFTLPVVIGAMVAVGGVVATAVWWLAQYDMRRVRRMDALYAEIRDLKHEMEAQRRSRKKDASPESDQGPADGDVGSGW
jgi:hypothetical protein